MKALYKYMKKAYALEMMQKGQCRVGTLLEYRDTERHGSEVGDSDEGTKTTYSDDSFIDWTKTETVPDLVRKFVKVAPGRNPVFKNVRFNRNETSPDCYVFSVTELLNPDAMREFGYDTAVKIITPNPFFKALTRCLMNERSIKPGFTFSKCVYTERAQHYSRENSIHPAFIKSPRYKYQQEVRAIWIPTETPIQPVVLECPQLRECCSLMSDAELLKTD